MKCETDVVCINVDCINVACINVTCINVACIDVGLRNDGRVQWWLNLWNRVEGCWNNTDRRH